MFYFVSRTKSQQLVIAVSVIFSGYPQLLLLHVRTSAGTYVKEWVHGEMGRTRPSLAHILGARADLLALDVTAVHLAWPPEHE